MAKARRYTQKQMKKRMETEGWVNTGGGKHVIKMSKPGHRPVTIPFCGGETLDIGLSQAILKQAGIDDD